MLKPKWRSKWIKRQVEMWGLELGKKAYCSPMPLTRDRRPINRDRCLGENELAIKRPCRRTAHIQWTLRNGSAGKLQTCTAAKTEPFPRYFPGKGHGAGEVTASESWKVRRAHAGARRSLAAPAPLRAGATGASGAQALQRRRAPRGPRPPARPSDSAPTRHPTNHMAISAPQLPKPRPGLARRQPMGGRA